MGEQQNGAPIVRRGMLEVVRAVDLEHRRWVFRYCDSGHALRLSWYESQTRETRRHKFRVQRKWSFTDTRSARPPIPADVAEEALKTFRDALTVEPS